jgi:hypothetical protein
MKTIRYTAIATTILMALLNLPAALGHTGMPVAINVLAALAGVAGVLAGVAFVRRASWAPAAVTGIGMLNLAGGIAAIASGWAGGAVGIVLGLAAAIAAGAVLAADNRALRAGRASTA